MRKRLWMLLSCVALILCVALGAAACGEEETEKTALSVPQNIKVSDGTLFWDPVEHADGYTVRINADESTVVKGESLKLSTVTSKLRSGKNSLSVRANETSEYAASDYSASVEYIHRVPFAAPQNLRVDVSTLRWDAVDGAASYTVKINSDETTVVPTNELDLTTVTGKLTLVNQLSVKVNPNDVLYLTESAYSAEVSFHYNAEAVAAAKAFEDTVNAITTITQENTQADAEAAETAIEAAETAYNALDDDAKEYAEAAKAAFEAKKTALETETAAATAAHAEFVAAITAAEEEMKKGTSATALEEKIQAVKAAQSGLSTLASGLVTADETGKIADLIDAMLKIVFAVEKNEKVLYNSDRPNEQPVFTLILKYVNVAGESMKLDVDPTIAISEQVEGGEKTPITDPEVTYDETNGVYAVRASFTNAFKDKKPITITYTVNDPMHEGEKTLALGAHGGIVYFENATGEAYPNHKLTLYGGTANQETIIEAYRTEDIVKKGVGESIEIKGLPFASGTKDDFENPESLRYFAAKAGITGNLSVSLLAYQRWEEDGKIRVSVINSASVSAPIDVDDISEEDAKERLPMPKFNGVELNIQQAVKDGSLAALLGLESLTNEEASKLVRLHIQVTHNGETKDHYEPLSSNYVHSLILQDASMRQLFYDLFQDESGKGYEVTIRLAFVEGSPYAGKLAESYPIYYSYAGKVYGGKFVPDLNNGQWDLGDGNGDINFRTQVISTESAYHDGALIYIFDTNGIEDVQSHIFTAEEAFAVYHIKSANNVSWRKANGSNSPLYEVIRAAWVQSLKEEGISLEDIDYTKTYSFVFAIGLVPNALGEQFHYSASDLFYATKNGEREVKEFTFAEEDVKAPNYAQFNFVGDNVEYLKPTEGLGRGEIFSLEKAAYIELKFTKGDVSYSVFLFEENGKVVIYKDKDKTGDSLSVGDVSNSWGSASDLSNKIKAWYGLDSMDIRDGWSYSTKVYVGEESLYFVDSDWSDPVEHNLG